MKKPDLLIKTPRNYQATLILAHGAGAPMDSEWMNHLTQELVSEKIKVVRFEFPYMNERRLTGKKRPPNTQKILLETWETVIELCKKESPLFIGGKSMGGRMATLGAEGWNVDGVIAFGFPFHAPGKEIGKRIDHFSAMKTKTLIIQGTRDSMGPKDELVKHKFSKNIKIKWLEDGDHSLKPRVKSGLSLKEHMTSAAKLASSFMVKNS